MKCPFGFATQHGKVQTFAHNKPKTFSQQTCFIPPETEITHVS